MAIRVESYISKCARQAAASASAAAPAQHLRLRRAKARTHHPRTPAIDTRVFLHRCCSLGGYVSGSQIGRSMKRAGSRSGSASIQRVFRLKWKDDRLRTVACSDTQKQPPSGQTNGCDGDPSKATRVHQAPDPRRLLQRRYLARGLYG